MESILYLYIALSIATFIMAMKYETQRTRNVYIVNFALSFVPVLNAFICVALCYFFIKKAINSFKPR